MKLILKYQVLLGEIVGESSFLSRMRGQPKSEIDLYIIGKVKQLRIERKLSQAALALKLDVSDAFVGQIENPKCRQKYSIEQLNRLAHIFGCSPKDFWPEKPMDFQ